MIDYKAQAEQVKAGLETALNKVADLEKQNENLDASVKELGGKIADLESKAEEPKQMSAKDYFTANLMAVKDSIVKMVKECKEKFSVEIKSIATPNANAVSVMVDPTIYADRPAPLAFLDALGVKTRTANKLAWIEASTTPDVGYVAELANNTHASDVAFVEKIRAFAKIATKMTISTEVEDWFAQVYNYCVGEGARLVNRKVNELVFKGEGEDGTNPNEIYGLWMNSLDFFYEGHPTYANPTFADALAVAQDTIAKNGFTADVAFVGWKDYTALRTLKDANGNYIFDSAKSVFNGIKVIPTDAMGVDEESLSPYFCVMDSSCAEIYAGNGYELEFIRNGAIDGYDIYFRKAVQVKSPTPNMGGILIMTSEYAKSTLEPSA